MYCCWLADAQQALQQDVEEDGAPDTDDPYDGNNQVRHGPTCHIFDNRAEVKDHHYQQA